MFWRRKEKDDLDIYLFKDGFGCNIIVLDCFNDRHIQRIINVLSRLGLLSKTTRHDSKEQNMSFSKDSHPSNCVRFNIYLSIELTDQYNIEIITDLLLDKLREEEFKVSRVYEFITD